VARGSRTILKTPGEQIATEIVTLIGVRDGRLHQGGHLFVTQEIPAIRGILGREIWMLIAPDGVLETVPLLRVQPTLTPHLLVRHYCIVAVVSDGGEVALQDAAEISTTMTGTDIMTPVIASQNGHIDRGVGRLRDA
jgi:hypothetical protein